MDKTKEQMAADTAMDRACLRLIAAYGMLPGEPSVIDYLTAYHEIATGLMDGALDAMKFATEKKE